MVIQADVTNKAERTRVSLIEFRSNVHAVSLCDSMYVVLSVTQLRGPI